MDQDLKGELLAGRVKGRAFWAEATHTLSLTLNWAGARRQTGGKPRLQRKLEARSADHTGACEEAAKGSQAWDGSAVKGEEGGGGANARAEPRSATTGTSQPRSQAREMLLCVSTFREGLPLTPRPRQHTFLSALDFDAFKENSNHLSIHNSVCCSRPDTQGREAA